MDMSPTFETFELPVLKQMVQCTISDHALRDMPRQNFRVAREQVVAEMATRLVVEWSVPGKRVEEMVVEFPASWWQFLKEGIFTWRWIPEAIKRRWPVKVTTCGLALEAIYPTIVVGGEQPWVKMVVNPLSFPGHRIRKRSAGVWLKPEECRQILDGAYRGDMVDSELTQRLIEAQH